MKLRALSIVATAAFGLAACGGSSRAAAPPVTTARTPATTAATTTTAADTPAPSLAGDRAAETSLRNALTAAKVSYTDHSSYRAADLAELAVIEPSLKYQTTASTAANEVSVLAVPGDQVWWATVRSSTGTCFGIEDNAMVGFTFAGTTTKIASCQAPATDPHWTDAHW